MKSTSYFRDLSDDDLLLAGKDRMKRFLCCSEDQPFTDALLERFEDLLHEVATLPLQDLRRQIHEAAATHGSTVTLWPAVEVLQAHVSPTDATDVGDRLTQLFGVEPSGPRTLH